MIAALATVVCLATPAVVPVAAPVVDWFRPPSCTWCAGNRGLEFAAEPGRRVVAPVSGTVAFVGPVGGVTYVVIRAAGGDGVNAVIGGIDAPSVGRGDEVTAGVMVGRAVGSLHLGFRIGPRREGRYVDPAPLLGLGRKPARLVAHDPAPVSLARRPGHPIRSSTQRHCSVLPPVVASARGPGP